LSEENVILLATYRFHQALTWKSHCSLGPPSAGLHAAQRSKTGIIFASGEFPTSWAKPDSSRKPRCGMLW